MAITYHCAECGEPVRRRAGYIHVNTDEKHRYRRARQQFDQAARSSSPYVDISAFLSMPSPAKWRAHHGYCDPNPNGNDYWFDVADVDTHEKLLRRTAHVLGKGWLRDTDWAGFLYSALAPTVTAADAEANWGCA